MSWFKRFFKKVDEYALRPVEPEKSNEPPSVAEIMMDATDASIEDSAKSIRILQNGLKLYPGDLKLKNKLKILIENHGLPDKPPAPPEPPPMRNVTGKSVVPKKPEMLWESTTTITPMPPVKPPRTGLTTEEKRRYYTQAWCAYMSSIQRQTYTKEAADKMAMDLLEKLEERFGE